jgi:hypothetical protein
MDRSPLDLADLARPIPTTRDGAEAEFNRIMTRAAAFQEMINFHIVNTARSSDPVHRARCLDLAITALENMEAQFRRARAAVALAAPTAVIPPPPRSLAGRLSAAGAPPVTRAPNPVRPRTF